LRHAQCSVSLRESNLGDIAAGPELDLRPQLFGDAKLLNDACDVNAGGTAAAWIGVDNGFCGEQCPAEIFNGGDGRYGCAGRRDNTDADFGNRRLARSFDLTIFDQTGNRLQRRDNGSASSPPPIHSVIAPIVP